MITKEEQEILDFTTFLWNKIIELPILHDSDNPETQRDIHNIQNRILARPQVRNR